MKVRKMIHVKNGILLESFLLIFNFVGISTAKSAKIQAERKLNSGTFKQYDLDHTKLIKVFSDLNQMENDLIAKKSQWTIKFSNLNHTAKDLIGGESKIQCFIMTNQINHLPKNAVMLYKEEKQALVCFFLEKRMSSSQNFDHFMRHYKKNKPY